MTPQRKAYDASSKWPEAVDPWLQSPGTPRWPQQIGTRLALSKWSGCLNWSCDGGSSTLVFTSTTSTGSCWHIHDHANVVDLWDVHGFLRFLKQRHLSVCLCLGLGPFPEWRTARNMTMALVTRPVRTLRMKKKLRPNRDVHTSRRSECRGFWNTAGTIIRETETFGANSVDC